MAACYLQKLHSDWKKFLTGKGLVLCSSLKVAKGRLQARKTDQPHLRLDIMYFCNLFTSTWCFRNFRCFRNSKNKFAKDRSFLTNLISLYYEMAGCGDKGGVDIGYLNFHKAIDNYFPQSSQL